MKRKKRQTFQLERHFLKILFAVIVVLLVLQICYITWFTWFTLPKTYLNLRLFPQDKGHVLPKNVSALIQKSVHKVTDAHVIDWSGFYFIVPNVIKSKMEESQTDSQTGATVCVHCTPNHLHYLPHLAKQWNSSISVTVFTHGDQTMSALKSVINLHLCDESVRNFVSFHFVFPVRLGLESMHKVLETGFHCDKSYLDGHREDTNYDNKQVPYPSNVLRNVAIKYSTTPFILVLDIDLVPSKDLHTQFQYYIQRKYRNSKSVLPNSKTAFVLPSFETNLTDVESMTKEVLKKHINEGTVRPFYIKACETCQEDTDYDKWINFLSVGFLETAYTVDWQMPWEPFYIADKNQLPLYDDRFKQYGFNRVSQICEMYLAGFEFVVLNNAFLVHRGFKEKSGFHANKTKEHGFNKILFQKFKQELYDHYSALKSNRQC